jgi:hypothetical protein
MLRMDLAVDRPATLCLREFWPIPVSRDDSPFNSAESIGEKDEQACRRHFRYR